MPATGWKSGRQREEAGIPQPTEPAVRFHLASRWTTSSRDFRAGRDQIVPDNLPLVPYRFAAAGMTVC